MCNQGSAQNEGEPKNVTCLHAFSVGRGLFVGAYVTLLRSLQPTAKQRIGPLNWQRDRPSLSCNTCRFKNQGAGGSFHASSSGNQTKAARQSFLFGSCPVSGISGPALDLVPTLGREPERNANTCAGAHRDTRARAHIHTHTHSADAQTAPIHTDTSSAHTHTSTHARTNAHARRHTHKHPLAQTHAHSHTHNH